jgi:hypothetical protein
MNRLIASLLAVVAVAYGSPASAQEDTTIHYVLAGEDTARGPYRDWIIVEPKGDGFQVIRQTLYESETDIQMGATATRDLPLRVVLVDLQGAVGHLENQNAKPDTLLTLTFGNNGAVESRGESTSGNSKGTGSRTAGAPSLAALTPAPARESADAGDSVAERGRHLLALGQDHVKRFVRKQGDRLVYDGVGLHQDFSISRYAHVGVGAKMRALRDDALTPEQKASKTAHEGRHAWLVTTVDGGVRVPLNTTLPVGSVKVGVGFEAGAHVVYEVTDLYPIPESVRDAGGLMETLRLAKERSFDLPLNASEALAMTLGAKRVFDGNGTLALSGKLTVGREVTNFDGVTRIGASARVGGFYRVRGGVRVAVTRLRGARVRVRATTTKTRTRGGFAELFAGASTDDGRLREELAPVLDYIDVAILQDLVVGEVRNGIKKALRFRLRGDLSRARENEVDVSHVYDLNTHTAAAAYERAVRGDFTHADRLSAQPGSGVERVFRVLKVEERTHSGVDLKLSVILDAGSSKDVSFAELDVDDPSGKTTFELFRFTHGKRFNLLKTERSKRLHIEVTRRSGPAEAAGASSRSFYAVLDQQDPTTRTKEVNRWKRLLRRWGLGDDSGLPTPEARFLESRYGNTRSRLEIGISDRGLRAVLSTPPEIAFRAYVWAYILVENRRPQWATQKGRDRIESSENDEHANTGQKAREELKAANRFVADLQGLAGAGTARERAKCLKGLASGARFGVFDIVASQRHLYTLAAILELAPKDTVSVDASLNGKRVRIEASRRGEAHELPVFQARD